MKRFLITVEIEDEPDEMTEARIKEEIEELLHVECYHVQRCEVHEQSNTLTFRIYRRRERKRAHDAGRREMNQPRRHKCWRCEEVFECHLCEVHRDHRLHQGSRKDNEAFECEDCIQASRSQVVRLQSHHSDRWTEYSQLTGRILRRGTSRRLAVTASKLIG